MQHTTASTAGSGLRTARLLRSMPLVTDAVLDGALTPAQAAVLTRLVDKIEPEALLEAQPAMILVAAAMDPAQLGMWVTHQIATHCEPALDTAEARGQDQRYLTHRREQDGTLHGRFVLSPEDSEVLLTALEPLALPGSSGVRAEQACTTAAWSGPQTRSRIEALLCDARISRVLLDSVRQVTGRQPLRDSVTGRQRRALAARDLSCTAKGCTRPPAMCDVHHLVRRSDGRPDSPRQPRAALPQTPRPVAPRQAPPALPRRPLAARPTHRTTRPAQPPVPAAGP